MSKIRLVRNIKKCARCGEDHDEIQIRQLTNPPDRFSWFAICPTLDEPILIKIENEPKGSDHER